MTSWQHELDELNRFVQSNVTSVLTEFIKDGTLVDFMANSDLWALARLLGPESGRDPVGLFWNLYGDGEGFHVRELFPDKAEEWDQIVPDIVGAHASTMSSALPTRRRLYSQRHRAGNIGLATNNHRRQIGRPRNLPPHSGVFGFHYQAPSIRWVGRNGLGLPE